MKFTQTLVALAIAAAATTAPTAFAQSADLSITGKIIPGACTVDLGNAGTVDLGDINVKDLNADAVTDLDPATLPLTVACDSQIRFAFQGTDNSAESSAFAGRYGLGLTPAEEKIGGAEINLRDVTIDTGVGYSTLSDDGGTTWSVANNSGLIAIPQVNLRGYAEADGVTTGPAATAALQGTLEVKARIQPTDDLTINGDVPLAGNVTLNLVYL